MMRALLACLLMAPAALGMPTPPPLRLSATTAARPARLGAELRRKRRYINLTGFPFPLGPLFERATTVQELHRGRVWAFEQEQSLGVGVGSTITANSRMVVVRLRSGDLWVLNPLAPTEELVEAVRALGGDVAHVVLGSTQYEHKIFVPAFLRAFSGGKGAARKRPKLYMVPDQWAFPLDFPPEMLGLGGATTLNEELPAERQPVWAAELPFAVLRPRRRLGLGYAAVEAAFVHRPTRSLLLTDALVRVPREAPAVLDRANLRAIGSAGNAVSLFAGLTNWRGRGEQIRAGDAADAALPRSAAEAEQRGWQLNAVLSLFFGPSAEAISQPARSFEALAGRWLVGPVCATLIYSNAAVNEQLEGWVEKIVTGKLGRFDTIIPAHFSVGRGSAADVRRAFAPVLAGSGTEPYDQGDVQLLGDLSAIARSLGVI